MRNGPAAKAPAAPVTEIDLRTTLPEQEAGILNAYSEDIEHTKAGLREEFPAWSIIYTTDTGRWWATRGPLVREALDAEAAVDADIPDPGPDPGSASDPLGGRALTRRAIWTCSRASWPPKGGRRVLDTT
ncbi:hypothetical protein AGRA3207_003812 [Actinomadura graeca]|uniref:Uncharacterized protein n=1 Tax=Actinomadura graeca TaxID=2750812 RepID=A0ABX8QVI0_9ACTN|nr:hypothetical protein [Actinomadura graeca]QXJ22756.1 hypothetical protein AGRA3207_003812 [Actinomadura graeca]